MVMQAHLFSGVFTKVTRAQSRPQIPERIQKLTTSGKARVIST